MVHDFSVTKGVQDRLYGTVLQAVAERVDAAMLGVGRNVRAFASGVKKHAEDPWSLEDVWLILVMRWVIKNGRRALYDAAASAMRRSPTTVCL